jgi:hypothetical protein
LRLRFGAATPVAEGPAGRDTTNPFQRLGAWRGLAMFWACFLAVVVVGSVTLAVLGPPAPRHPAASAAIAPARPAVRADQGAAASARGAPGDGVPSRPPSVALAAPDPALLDPAPADGSAMGLPRIGTDGRTPMRVYAGHFDPATKAPRIAVMIAGAGLDAAASADAIRALPAGVTLAISPYASMAEATATAAAARQAGHEYLISIPMEPQGYAQNDPGQRALLTTMSAAENAQRLDWVLSRLTGYVGGTGALGAMHGERFAEVQDDIDPMLAALAGRGLLYVDPRPNAMRLPFVWSRAVDAVIDDPPTAASIDARLAELERRAHDTGSALGLIDAIRPVTIEHLVAWVGNLEGRGYALAPVSAVVRAPPGTSAAPSKPPQ